MTIISSSFHYDFLPHPQHRTVSFCKIVALYDIMHYRKFLPACLPAYSMKQSPLQTPDRQPIFHHRAFLRSRDDFQELTSGKEKDVVDINSRRIIAQVTVIKQECPSHYVINTERTHIYLILFSLCVH